MSGLGIKQRVKNGHVGGGPLHPRKHKCWRFFSCRIEDGTCLIAVLLTSSSSRRSMFPRFSGILSSFEQPERIKILRESELMLHGRLVRDLQSFKFSKVSRLRTPTDGWTSYKFTQPCRISFSRFGAPVKSGTLIKFRESLRSRIFNLGKLCDKTIKLLEKIIKA